ncbi:hypothetical protein FRC08_005079 [Ceratobasidium sp. 394]|nr:hypothetical protein FRC08_005079 [Ceratobasidium sp. 394]KAG9098671.1 hypothetical protein FS749_003295 [Ceratobasidium sp. UAMH 11750]
MSAKVVSSSEAISTPINDVEEFDSTFYCIVCMSDLPCGQAIVIKNCGHIHCYNCWRTYRSLRREEIAEDITLIRQLVCPSCRGNTQLSCVGLIELVGMPRDEEESINKLIEDTIALRVENKEIAEKCEVLANKYRDRQNLLLQLQEAYKSTTDQLLAVLGDSEGPMELDE